VTFFGQKNDKNRHFGYASCWGVTTQVVEY
jgi:hypothetical protein